MGRCHHCRLVTAFRQGITDELLDRLVNFHNENDWTFFHSPFPLSDTHLSKRHSIGVWFPGIVHT